MSTPASTHHKRASPLNDPRYKPAPYTPRRAKFTEHFDPSILPANNVSVIDFAYASGTHEPEITSQPSRSILRKLFSSSRRKFADLQPCSACTKNKSETMSTKQRVDSAISLSGRPLETKAEPTTSTSNTTATGTVALTEMGKAHPGRRWTPGVDLDPFALNPSVPRRRSCSPKSESKARQKAKAELRAFFNSSDSENGAEGDQVKFKTRSQTFQESLDDESNEPGLVALATARDDGGFEASMSGAIQAPETESETMEFVTANPAIQTQINQEAMKEKGDKAKKESQAQASCQCPCCKKPTFVEKMKGLFRKEEGRGRSRGEEKGKSNLREEIPRLDLKIQKQLGF